jgi:TetR/AcrR family transcriptional regulator, tetracycline repressor protein
MAEHPEHGSRAALDRERVVRVALDLLDEVGLDDLTMRRLAERLGVTAASLYWYVRDKDELLELLADAISAEIPLPDPSRPWRTALEALARSFRQVAQAHRDAARVLVATMPTGPHRLLAIDAMLGLLSRAGFSPPDAGDIAYLLNVFAVGFMLDEALGPQPTPAHPPQPGVSGGATPLERLARGHLIVERGAVDLTIRADASLTTLYQLTCEGRPPEMEVREGTVRIRRAYGRRSSCDLTLAGSLMWEIDIEGGALRFTADLRHLRLASLRIAGGVDRTTLQLPQAAGTIPARIDGGAHKLRVERPSTSAIHLRLNRASSHITLDGLRLSAVGPGTDLESPDYATASERYNLEIGGGVSELSILATAPEADTAAGADPQIHEQAGSSFDALSPDEYPNLAALSGYLAERDLDRRFEVGLQIMLDGLERRLAASGRPPPVQDVPEQHSIGSAKPEDMR